MSLVVTPVGEYENAFFCLNGSLTAPNRVGRDYGYYGILVREQPKEMIDRVATFSVIARQICNNFLLIGASEKRTRRLKILNPSLAS